MPHAFRRRAQFPGPAVYALPSDRRFAHPILPQQPETTLEGNPWKCPHQPGAWCSPMSIAAARSA